MIKKALITGITGQDGSYLAEFLCNDVISEEEIRGFDSFTDDNALERIKDSLYELTLA